MANSKVVIEVVATSKGMKILVNDVEAATKATNKLKKSQDAATSSANRFDKQNKSLYQSNLSSAKSFSKMNQTIGGDGGSGALVGSYAVLAANVFALTAAFNTFRQAAAVEKLTEGLQAFSATTGQSLDLVSKRLQEATGNAVSFEQAMRTAALSTSAGFGTTEMEGLTRVAKGASLALGRDMGDALDRLTRGAIKLEPEILDELGIMVRLDDATEAYAATLGKTASQLTRFERQQAFMNAIISEGETKFGDITDSIDPNPYDKLAAAAADLAKGFINVINLALVPMINFFLYAKGIFLGLVTMFAGSIAKRMLPAFGDLTRASKESAAAALQAIEQSVAMGTQVAAEAQKAIKPLKGMPDFFHKIAPAIKNGTATTKEMSTAQGVLTREINKLGKQGTKEYDNLSKANKKLVDNMTKQRDLIISIKSQQSGTAGLRAMEMAQAKLKVSQEEVAIMELTDQRVFGLKATYAKYANILSRVKAAQKTYYHELIKANKATRMGNIFTRAYTTSLSFLKAGFRGAALSAKIFGKALIGAIPVIGQIIAIISILWTVVKGIAKAMGFFSEESKAAKDANKDLNKVLDGIEKKMEAIKDVTDSTNHKVQETARTYKIMGGLMKTIADEAFRAQRADEEAGNFDEDKLLRKWFLVGNEVKRMMNHAGDASPVIRSLANLEKESEMTASFIEEKLGMSFSDFVVSSIKAGDSVGEMTKKAKELLIEAELKFNGVSQAVEGMATTFTEAEKEANKFFKAITESTKFDGIQLNVNALNNDLNSIIKQVREAGGDSEDVLKGIGEAGIKMGSGMAAIIGDDTIGAFQNLQATDQAILAVQRKKLHASGQDLKNLELAEETLKEQYKDRVRILGIAIDKELPGAKEKLDILIKETLLLKGQIKFVKERSKNMLAVAKNQHTILAAKKAEDAINQKQIDAIKLEKQIYEGTIASANKKIAAGKTINDLTDGERDALNRVAKLDKDIEIMENEIAANLHTNLEARVAQLNTMKEQLNLAKQLQEAEQKNLLTRIELQAMTMTGTGATGAATASADLNIARQKMDMASKEFQLKMMIIEAEHNLLVARANTEIAINEKRIKEIGDATDRESIALTAINKALVDSKKISEQNVETNRKIIDQQILGAVYAAEGALNQVFGNVGNMFTSSGGADALASTMAQVFAPSLQSQLLKETQTAKKDLLGKKDKTDEDLAEIKRLEALEAKLNEDIPTAAQEAARSIGQMGLLIQQLFGEDGAVLSSLAFFSATVAESWEGIGEGFKAMSLEVGDDTEALAAKQEKIGDALAGVGNIIGSIAQLAAASAKQRIKAVDDEIAAEKKKDGKSKESLAKIKALEMKKEAMERKAFERNKKLQMAQIIVNTAAAVMKTLGDTGFFGSPLAMAIAALGAAQLSMVAGTSYQGGGSVDTNATPSTIEVGKRDNKVDVSKGATAGETAYLRGQQGIGTNANTFIPGGAAGMKKGYAAGGEILVGERGPEIIQPTGSGYNVIPNDKIGGQTNVNFSINAVDAAGVEELLTAQRGNIIGMIREAAHEHGEEFMEDVNTGAYGG